MEGALDRVGLCARCANARTIESARGSVFWLCRLGETDPRFPKYPRLPIVRCDGYTSSEVQGNQR